MTKTLIRGGVVKKIEAIKILDFNSQTELLERLFLGVLIEVYFSFPRIIFLIFNFSIFENVTLLKINLLSLARML